MTLVYHNARFSCKTTERANDFHATSVYIAHAAGVAATEYVSLLTVSS